MHMLGHNDIAEHAQAKTLPYPLEGCFKDALCPRCVQRPAPMVATKRYEVSLSRLLKPLSSPRHSQILGADTTPLKQKKLEWATRRLRYGFPCGGPIRASRVEIRRHPKVEGCTEESVGEGDRRQLSWLKCKVGSVSIQFVQ